MSLINDALRQASQAHQQQGRVSAPADASKPPPLPPAVNPAPLSPWPSLIKLVGIALLVLGLLGGGGWYFYRTMKRPAPAVVAKAAPPSRSASTSLSGLPSQPRSAVTTNAPQPTMAQSQSVSSTGLPPATIAAAPAKSPPTNAHEATPPADPKPALAAAAPFKWPLLRLQGIFFRPPNSAVVINNKTLYEEDEIQGVKVAQIDRQGVTLWVNGQTNTLRLR